MKRQNNIQSYLGRCTKDPAEAEEIIKRLEGSGVPFERILESLQSKAAAALGRLGGKAGKGKSKARTSAQARKAALARWEKEEKK